MSGLKDAKRSANRIAKYNLSGWIGIQDTPEELLEWRGAIRRELHELEGSHSIDDLEICSMCWFVITDEESDQTPMGKGSNLLVGTAAQITDNLKRLKEAGLTMPLIWPPFQDVPVAKTLDDLKRLKEEILPQVDAMQLHSAIHVPDQGTPRRCGVDCFTSFRAESAPLLAGVCQIILGMPAQALDSDRAD